MKTIDEILACGRIYDYVKGIDGASAFIQMPRYKASLIWSNGAGWEHVSISPLKHRFTPTWDDMCMLKDIFFYDHEEAIQIHPAKDVYVNNMQNCLHLWRCTYKEMVLPPSVLVGRRDGQTKAEIMEEIKAAYAEAGEKLKEEAKA